jgi:hypothetical protein
LCLDGLKVEEMERLDSERIDVMVTGGRVVMNGLLERWMFHCVEGKKGRIC